VNELTNSEKKNGSSSREQTRTITLKSEAATGRWLWSIAILIGSILGTIYAAATQKWIGAAVLGLVCIIAVIYFSYITKQRGELRKERERLLRESTYAKWKMANKR